MTPETKRPAPLAGGNRAQSNQTGQPENRPLADERQPLPCQLRELAADVRRLLPHRSDPERFHVDKDDVAHRLVSLAVRLEGAR
jgi:hypothetical protein